MRSAAVAIAALASLARVNGLPQSTEYVSTPGLPCVAQPSGLASVSYLFYGFTINEHVST